MNTRLQVEHPVTEMVTGLDLVELQIKVAQGDALPITQDDVTQRGHAIECRLYAEDPAQNFMPSTGPLLVYDEPVSPQVRVDSGVQQGGDVTVHYDPMLSKLITVGATRDEALKRMSWALTNYPVLGVTTNHALLLAVLTHADFVAGNFDTGFLNTYSPTALLEKNRSAVQAILPALAGVLSKQRAASSVSHMNSVAMHDGDVWQGVGPWRNV
jgi:acetyl/propionyl-CoA carboxylase alpha subunit